jgi:hypothetical protein
LAKDLWTQEDKKMLDYIKKLRTYTPVEWTDFIVSWSSEEEVFESILKCLKILESR